MTTAPRSGIRLALFDLDGTLLDGDTDVLWCAFLIDEGVLDRATFELANRDVAARYAAGSIGVQAFCDFYAATLAGRTPMQWAPLRDRFVADRIVPRLKPRGRAAVERHRAAGDRIVLTTATNRFLTEPVAAALAIHELIATELAVDAEGAFSGRTEGVLNMRAGKIARLETWLDDRALPRAAIAEASFYSDSINDRPLLAAVGRAVAVDADEQLAALAASAGWEVERFVD